MLVYIQIKGSLKIMSSKTVRAPKPTLIYKEIVQYCLQRFSYALPMLIPTNVAVPSAKLAIAIQVIAWRLLMIVCAASTSSPIKLAIIVKVSYAHQVQMLIAVLFKFNESQGHKSLTVSFEKNVTSGGYGNRPVNLTKLKLIVNRPIYMMTVDQQIAAQPKSSHTYKMSTEVICTQVLPTVPHIIYDGYLQLAEKIEKALEMK